MSSSDRSKWDTLATDARQELRERFRDYPEGFYQGEPHDVIHEIADSSVPVYTLDRFALLADPDVGGRTISDAGLLPAGGSLAEIVGVYIFDALEEVLWDEWREMESEQAEAEEV